MTIGQLSIVSVVPDRRWRIGSACGSGHGWAGARGSNTSAYGSRRGRGRQNTPTTTAPPMTADATHGRPPNRDRCRGNVVPVRCKGLKTIAPDGARRARAHHGHREQSVPTECAPGCEARRGKAARQNSASVRRVSSLSGSA
jgi:hypothetical protein